MNNSLGIIYSKENLTFRFQDYSNVVFLPTICLFGILTSLGCLIGSFKKDESNAKFLFYIFLNSLVDLLFLLTQFFSLVIRCGALCPFGYSYISKSYEIYVFWFLGYTLVNSQTFFSVYMAYDRLRMFSGKLESRRTSIYWVFTICASIAVILNVVTYVLVYEVCPVKTLVYEDGHYEYIYSWRIREFFRAHLMQVIITFCLAFKDPFMYLVVCLANLIVCVRFKSYLNKKKELTKRQPSSN